jgi:cardiolipin synthase
MRYANKISAIRILIIPFLIWAIFSYSPSDNYLRFVVLGLFILAAISDWLDGFIARQRKEITYLGPIIDPLADKLLLMSTFICLYLRNNVFGPVVLPLWLVLAVVIRDLTILFGTFLIFVVRQDIKIIPTSWGKLTTFFQMATVVCVLLQFEYSYIAFWISFVLTSVSGFDYIRKGLVMLTFGEKN